MGHLPGGLAGYTVRIVLWTVCPATRWSKPGSMGYCSVNLVDVGGLMKRAFLWGCLTFCILLVACTVFYPPREPIPFLRKPSNQTPASELWVMLPGRSDDPEDLVEEGLSQILQQNEEHADIWIVDAHLGYYVSRTLIERLHTDVILPARRSGYARIHLLGISMGGLGALLYARQHADSIDSLLLLAPFLGDEDVIEEIRAAGGLASWSVPPVDPEEDYQRAVWLWLKGYTTSEPRPSLAIGWGLDDEFAPACALLADNLPASRTATCQGGHEWGPWRELLLDLLQKRNQQPPG